MPVVIKHKRFSAAAITHRNCGRYSVQYALPTVCTDHNYDLTMTKILIIVIGGTVTECYWWLWSASLSNSLNLLSGSSRRCYHVMIQGEVHWGLRIWGCRQYEELELGFAGSIVIIYNNYYYNRRKLTETYTSFKSNLPSAVVLIRNSHSSSLTMW